MSLRPIGGVAVYMLSPGHQPLLPGRSRTSTWSPRGAGVAAARAGAARVRRGGDVQRVARIPSPAVPRPGQSARRRRVPWASSRRATRAPVADRLDRLPGTPCRWRAAAHQLQIVELNERDERDIYTLCYHHEPTEDPSRAPTPRPIRAAVRGRLGPVAYLQGTIERCIADVDGYDLDAPAREQILTRLTELWGADRSGSRRSSRWRRRNRLGE